MTRQDKVIYTAIILAVVLVNFMLMLVWFMGRMGRDEVDLAFSRPVVREDRLTTSIVITDPGKEKITAVDITVAFDPDKLVLIEAELGQALTEPTLLKKTIDEQEGQIRIAMFTMSPKEPKEMAGSLMDLEFKILDKEDPGKISWVFVDGECHIATDGSENMFGKGRSLNYQLPADER